MHIAGICVQLLLLLPSNNLNNLKIAKTFFIDDQHFFTHKI